MTVHVKDKHGFFSFENYSRGKLAHSKINMDMQGVKSRKVKRDKAKCTERKSEQMQVKTAIVYDEVRGENE